MMATLWCGNKAGRIFVQLDHKFRLEILRTVTGPGFQPRLEMAKYSGVEIQNVAFFDAKISSFFFVTPELKF